MLLRGGQLTFRSPHFVLFLKIQEMASCLFILFEHLRDLLSTIAFCQVIDNDLLNSKTTLSLLLADWLMKPKKGSALKKIPQFLSRQSEATDPLNDSMLIKRLNFLYISRIYFAALSTK